MFGYNLESFSHVPWIHRFICPLPSFEREQKKKKNRVGSRRAHTFSRESLLSNLIEFDWLTKLILTHIKDLTKLFFGETFFKAKMKLFKAKNETFLGKNETLLGKNVTFFREKCNIF